MTKQYPDGRVTDNAGNPMVLGKNGNFVPVLQDRPDYTGKIGDMNPQQASYVEANQTYTPSTPSASPWASMGTNQQAANQSAALAGAPGIQGAALNQASQGMAMRGGLSGGAANRMGRAAVEGGALAGQSIRAQGASDALGAQMAGADMTSANDKINAGTSQDAQAYNTQNAIKNLGGRNAHALANYGTNIKGFSAGQTANALAAAGGKK